MVYRRKIAATRSNSWTSHRLASTSSFTEIQVVLRRRALRPKPLAQEVGFNHDRRAVRLMTAAMVLQPWCLWVRFWAGS